MRYSTVCQPRRETVQGWPVLNVSDLLIIFSFLIYKSASSSKDDDIMPSVISMFNSRLVYTEYFPGGIRSFVSGKLGKNECVTASSRSF